MVTKNLKKKVGCALIAASLLAASSVQGSNAQDAEQVYSLIGMNFYVPRGGGVRIYFHDSCKIAFEDGDLVSCFGFRGNASAGGLKVRYMFKVRDVPFEVSVSNDLKVGLSPGGWIVVLPREASYYKVMRLIATMCPALNKAEFWDE
ncbi:MAG: hypothetical protein LBF34_02585 [Puniceicoccales bacterium]|nr:hypothetical protein [Puniceicoccales bacterium]